jgi:hypothetical protein
MKEKLCKTCKYYTLLDQEYSGLSNWHYGIGQCVQNKSVHGGWTPIPSERTNGGRKDLPEWNKCEHHKFK